MATANQYGINLAQIYQENNALKASKEARQNNALMMDWKKEDRAKAKIRATTLNNLTSSVANGDKGAMGKLASFDPDTAKKLQDVYSKMDEQKREQFKDNIDKIGRMSAFVIGSDNPDQAYQMMRQNLAPEVAANMPEQYDANFMQMKLAQAREVDDMLKTPDKVNFGGQDVLYKDGQVIGNTQSQARTNMLNTNKQSEIDRNFKTSEREAGQAFKATEGAKNRANKTTNASIMGNAIIDRRSFEEMKNRVPASKKTNNDMQKSILGGEKALIGLEKVASSFQDDFLTYEGRAKAAAGGIADKLGSKGEYSKFNAKRTKLINNAKQFFNQYRKEITGAAASERELKDLEASMFNVNQGPEEFKSSFDNFIGKMRDEVESQKDTLVNGVDVGKTPTPKIKEPDTSQLSDEDLLSTYLN